MANNSGTVAPVCNAVQKSPVIQPTVKPIVPFTVPIPGVPGSIIYAIQQLQFAVNQLTNQQTINNITVGQPGSGSGGVGGGSAPTQPGRGKTSPQPTEPGAWEETDRVTEDVKVVNPDDDSQFVIVREIVRLKFINPSTGDTIVWKRDG